MIYNHQYDGKKQLFERAEVEGSICCVPESTKGRIKAALIYCIIYLVFINSFKSSSRVSSISFLLRELSWPMIINSKV